MRRLLVAAVGMTALVVFLASAGSSRAATASPYLALAWTRVGSGPVLSPGPSGAWDSWYVIAGPVVRAQGVYEMFYTGSPGGGVYSIGLATSADGIRWTKDPANPVIPDGQSSVVLFENGQFRMWYTAAGRMEILYATSSDGRVWDGNASNPALVAGPGWDSSGITSGAVVHNATGYSLFYAGSLDQVHYQGGLATSTDGLHWTKSAQNPVLPFGLSGVWDAAFVVPCGILDTGSARVLWYVGGDTGSGFSWRLGVAASEDGTHWTASSQPALNVSSPGKWDSLGIGRGYVVPIGGTLWMWYTGLNASAQWKIGLARASTPPGSSPSSLDWLVPVGLFGAGAAAIAVVVLALRPRGPRRGIP